MGNLVDRLLKENISFNFFQALSLLEEMYKKEGHVKDPIDSGRIRLEPECSLGFPPNDIAAISEDKGVISFMLSFMELAGVSSPLPTYFSEYININPDSSRALRDFLTLFNHRIYTLFYRSWKKYFLLQSTIRGRNDPLTRRVASLAGINNCDKASDRHMQLVAYSGVLAGFRRSSSGLQAMLSDVFGGIPVEIENWVPRWTEIKDLKSIGIDSRLGVNTILGTKKWDIAGKFRVIVGPLQRNVFETFLQGTENIRCMQELVSGFMVDPLDFDIQVKLQSCDLIPVQLGTDNALLGRTSALGESSGKSDIQSITIEL